MTDKKNKTKKKCNFKNITRRRLLKKAMLPEDFNLFNITYKEPSKKDLAVGLVYFNSAKSKRLLMNYLYMREKLNMANIPNYTIEMYLNTPEIKDAIHVKTDFILFQKERLCHVLEKSIPKQYTKLLFLDADLIFDDVNWYSRLSERLDSFNVVQPFSTALWLDITYNHIIRERSSIVFNLKLRDLDKNTNKNTKCSILGFHPGFAWGFQRHWFKNNGFFQEAILGSGDTITSTSWISKPFIDNYVENCKYKYIDKAIKEYNNSLDHPSVCYLEGNMYHLWHGDINKRQYKKRNNILKGVDDIRNILKVEKSGLYALKDNTFKSRIMKYFKDRDDDGI
jgi:hypothetical protein